MVERLPPSSARHAELLAEEQRLALELQSVRAALARLDGRQQVPPSAFEGTDLSPATQLWLVDHGIKNRTDLDHPIFTPKAFLSTLQNPTTDCLGVYDEVSRYCVRVKNPAWTQAEVECVWQELNRRNGALKPVNPCPIRPEGRLP